MIDTGASENAIALAFGIRRASIGRHRRDHIVKPTLDRLAILNGDNAAREERRILAEAAGSEEPSTQALIEASLGMRRQMEKLNNIENRLERMAQASEQAGSPIGVSQVSSQQLRAIETGSKLAGTGGFKPVAAIPQGAERNVVSITFEFPNAKHTETIDFVGKVVDGNVVDPSAIPDDEDLPKPYPNRKINPDEKLAGSYWDFTKLPDKPADEDDEKA
jgi:hypothetical protein